MYEMLAIKRLFHRDSDFLTFKAITEEPIPDIRDRRPDLPPGMRAALVQAMARDPNGRFDTAQAFGNAIRNVGRHARRPGVAAGARAPAVHRFRRRDGGARRDPAAADDPNAAPATGTGPMTRQSASLMPPPLPIARAIPPAAPLPLPRSGELNAPTGPVQRQMDSVPSMMVTPGSSKMSSASLTPPMMPAKIQMPGPEPVPAARPPTAPVIVLEPEVPDLSGAMPVDNWMADPDTDLLRAHRARTLLKVLGVLVAAGLAAAGVWLAINGIGGSSGDDGDSSTVQGGAPVAAADAGVEYVPRPDAKPEMSHDQIVALSKFGFYTIHASAPTQIIVDDNPPAKTPLDQYPLHPGPHKVHALGPNGKTKDMKITILGGQTTDDGTITW